MNLPDKIYLHEISAEELTENLPYHVCYIRKDALLEWAKEQASTTEKLNGKDAMLKAWDTLIDKIESL